MDPFDKKTVYHSQLRDACSDRPLVIQILSNPQKSKFKNNGEERYFIDFKVEGNPHQYTIENDDIRQKLTGLKGHMVSIVATGTREEADIEIHDAAAPGTEALETPPPRSQPRQPAADAPPADRPPSAKPTGIVLAKKAAMQGANGYLIALEATHYIDGEHMKKHGHQLTEAHFQAAVASMFIYLDRSGAINQLPTSPIAPAEKSAPPPPPPPKPKPVPPPADPDIDQLDGDDIPF